MHLNTNVLPKVSVLSYMQPLEVTKHQTRISEIWNKMDTLNKILCSLCKLPFPKPVWWVTLAYGSARWKILMYRRGKRTTTGTWFVGERWTHRTVYRSGMTARDWLVVWTYRTWLWNRISRVRWRRMRNGRGTDAGHWTWNYGSTSVNIPSLWNPLYLYNRIRTWATVTITTRILTRLWIRSDLADSLYFLFRFWIGDKW